jgi:osmotically-inducible protein OsmY
MNAPVVKSGNRLPVDVRWTMFQDADVLFLATFAMAVAGSLAPAHADVDGVLKERIKDQASGDKRLAGTQVTVLVQKQDVILSGKVRLYIQKMIYEQIAWHTQGVREVDNEIRVVPQVPTTDEQIKAIIIRFLIEHEEFHTAEITLDANEGRVVLSGRFREPEDVLRLKHWVAQVEGVVAIEIDVKTYAGDASTMANG